MQDSLDPRGRFGRTTKGHPSEEPEGKSRGRLIGSGRSPGQHRTRAQRSAAYVGATPACQGATITDGGTAAPHDQLNTLGADLVSGWTAGTPIASLTNHFDISQPTLSFHLKKLRDAGIVDSERQGLWAYYHVVPGSLDDLSAWLG